MKRMMMLVSAIMMSASTFAIEKVNNVEPFEGINIHAPVRIRFVSGDDYIVDIQSADPLAASAIRTSVEDGVLKIRTLDEHSVTDDICITVMCPVKPQISIGRHLEVNHTPRDTGNLLNK